MKLSWKCQRISIKLDSMWILLGYINLSLISWKMARHTLKILRCGNRNIFKVCLVIFKQYAWKGEVSECRSECKFETSPKKDLILDVIFGNCNIFGAAASGKHFRSSSSLVFCEKRDSSTRVSMWIQKQPS